jgi:hypothetical protein
MDNPMTNIVAQCKANAVAALADRQAHRKDK